MRGIAAVVGAGLWLVSAIAVVLSFEILNRQSGVLDCADRDLPAGILEPHLTARVIEARPDWFPLGWHCDWLISDGTLLTTQPDPVAGIVAYASGALGAVLLIAAVAMGRRTARSG